MTKPNAAAIRRALPLSKLPTRGADPILVCNVCGHPADPIAVWREHDEQDRPLPGHERLVFLGVSNAHTACRKVLNDHPRLYAEVTGYPGTFPSLCGPCEHRRGFVCSHPKLKANGGPGLSVKLDTMFGNAIICSRGQGCRTPTPHAVECEGRPNLVHR